MAPLKVPDTGLLLESPDVPNAKVPIQAFAITLGRSAIEEMIKCVQDGGSISLGLGKTPTLKYGETSYKIPQSNTAFSKDLYLTQPFESLRKAHKIPVTSDIHTKLPKTTISKKTAITKAEPQSPKKHSRISSGSSKSPSLDSDLDTRQSSMARAEAARGSASLSGISSTDIRAARDRNQFLRAAEVAQSQPTSPSVSMRSGSPQRDGISLTADQVLERNKLQRATLVHELAVKDRSKEYLLEKWTGKPEDFMNILNKAAKPDASGKLWTLAKSSHWKELDVWNYDYDTQEDREKAISNAISNYDKLRLSPNQEEWQRLLPVEERGKGKCLSKIQASLSRSMMGSKLGTEDMADAMSRSKSNPLPKPTSKKSEKEKRLNVAPAPKKVAISKTAKTKAVTSTSSTPNLAVPSSRKTQALSAEFVSDTSDSESHVSMAASDESRLGSKMRKASPVGSLKAMMRESPSKAKPSLPAKPPAVSKLVASPTKSRAAPKAVSKTTKPSAGKRPREEDEFDDDSSSSTAPLSKRPKAKATSSAAETSLSAASKARSSETARTSLSSNGIRKGASPAIKQTPISPSNSDRSESQNRSKTTEKPAAKKRHTEYDDFEPPVKSSKETAKSSREAKETKQAKDAKAPRSKESTEPKEKRPRGLSEALINKAARFKYTYSRYTDYHYRISRMSNPPQHELDYLNGLREKLKDMKTDIYHEHMVCLNS